MTHATSRKVRPSVLAVAGMTGVLMFAGLAPAAAAPAAPDFGPNVRIFDPSTPVDQINAYLQGIAHEPEFGTNRHAVFFAPGTYGSATDALTSDVGYYTSIAGLGASPDDVVVRGALHVDPVVGRFGTSALNNFWRSLGNLDRRPGSRPGRRPTRMQLEQCRRPARCAGWTSRGILT